MFNSNFSIIFISKMVALNSAPSQRLVRFLGSKAFFAVYFLLVGQGYFWSWFIVLFVFPLCHAFALALFVFYYIRIYSPCERIHPYKRAQSIFQKRDLGSFPVSPPVPFQHVLLGRIKARRHPLSGINPNFQNLLSS